MTRGRARAPSRGAARRATARSCSARRGSSAAGGARPRCCAPRRRAARRPSCRRASRCPPKSPRSVSTSMSGRSSFRRRTVLATCDGAAVEQVVAVDHRHDDVLERHAREGPRDVLGLAHVDRAARVARRHRAEAAAARARVAEEHDGRRALAPALADVRAARLLADRVKVEARGTSPSARCSARRPGARTLSQAGLGAKRPGGAVVDIATLSSTRAREGSSAARPAGSPRPAR